MGLSSHAQQLTQAISLLAFAVSVLALVVTIKNYRRKAGVLIRGTFSMSSSIDCDDPYVSEVLLENAKDRAVTIFAIFLRVGANIYVEVEDLAVKPLVLGPFDTYHKRYGPIEFYADNTSRIGLRNVLEDLTAHRRLVLSTSHGKHMVRSRILRWSPVADFFANYFTSVIRPVRSTYKGEDLGSNVKYVVEIVSQDGREEIAPLRQGDHVYQMFRDFTLTEQSLSSNKALEEFLQLQIAQGKLLCKSFTVHDLTEWRAIAHKSYSHTDTRKLQPCGFFWYHAAGGLWTRYSNWQTRRENRGRLG